MGGTIIPTKKLRGTEGRNEHVPTLTESMGLGTKRPAIHAATGEIHKVNTNIKKGARKGKARGGGIKSTANYDATTRVNLPSPKGGKKKGRASTKKGM